MHLKKCFNVSIESDITVDIVTACVADIAFVIDNSGSIRNNDPPGGNNWNLILEFVKSIISVFDVAPDAARFAAIDFGTTELPAHNVLFSRQLAMNPRNRN